MWQIQLITAEATMCTTVMVATVNTEQANGREEKRRKEGRGHARGEEARGEGGEEEDRGNRGSMLDFTMVGIVGVKMVEVAGQGLDLEPEQQPPTLPDRMP